MLELSGKGLKAAITKCFNLLKVLLNFSEQKHLTEEIEVIQKGQVGITDLRKYPSKGKKLPEWSW